MDDKTIGKALILMVVIAAALIAIPIGNQTGGILKALFGSDLWISGSNGIITNPASGTQTGGTTQTTLIPTGRVSFKLIVNFFVRRRFEFSFV